jgi:hypothetical protein
MKKLKESEILQMIREEWRLKLNVLNETIDAALVGKVAGKEKLLITPALKLRHTTSKFLYTVKSASPRGVVLITPDEQKEFSVDKDTLESEYEID